MNELMTLDILSLSLLDKLEPDGKQRPSSNKDSETVPP